MGSPKEDERDSAVSTGELASGREAHGTHHDGQPVKGCVLSNRGWRRDIWTLTCVDWGCLHG